MKTMAFYTGVNYGKTIEHLKHAIATLGPEFKIEVVESPKVRDLEIENARLTAVVSLLEINHPGDAKSMKPTIFGMTLEQLWELRDWAQRNGWKP